MVGSRHAVLIGAGITGVLTALDLLRAGWSVTLLEAEHVGSGSSSRTAAGIRQQFSTESTVRGMRYAVQAYQRFSELVEDGTSPLISNGYLFLYDDADRWEAAQARVTMQVGAGLTEVEALAASDLQHRFPQIDHEAVLGGTFCPSDGFLLPALVYNEGARQVRLHGGTLLQRAPVTRAEHAGGRLVAVHTPKGRIEGDVFFDCTNAWTHRLGQILGAEPLPVSPYRRYLWFVARGGALPAQDFKQWPMIISPKGTYGRPENADSLLMGWSHKTPAHLDFTREDQDIVPAHYSHGTDLDARPYAAWAELASVVTPLEDFDGVTATTAGYYGTTPDHNPYLGFDRQVPNLIRLVGHSGHGAMFGPFTAAVGTALAEAGRDLDTLDLPTGSVSLRAFRLGRSIEACEAMVI